MAAGLFTAGLFAVGALGRESSPPQIVVDQSIGGVSIGMTQAQVTALVGGPDSTLPIALRGGGTGLLARYAVQGGVLIVEYAGGVVVSIETNSRFFRTEGGLGPGTSKAGLHGFHEDFCSLGLWDGTSSTPPTGVVTIFERSGDNIADVTIAQLGYYSLCESEPADQELPDPLSSNVQLSVQIDPNGGGFVRSTPYQIDCPTQCTATYSHGATTSLHATPTGGFAFTGWSGACQGTGDCMLTMNGDRTVVAHFSGEIQLPPPPPTTTPKTTTGQE